MSPLRLLSAAPARRRAEILLLCYSPIWIGVIALCQLTHCFTVLGDLGLLLFGLGLAAPPLLLPFLPALHAPAERALPLGDRYLTRAMVFIALLSFVQNDFGAELFMRGLGMQYHFNTTWLWRGTPVFLYLVTVAYFSTYFVLLQIGWRALRGLVARLALPRPALRVLHVLLLAPLCYAVAFGETYFMASDHLRAYFSYADKGQALWLGSLCYGTLFFISLPVFAGIDEGPARRPLRPLRDVLWRALGVNTLILLTYNVYLATLLRR